MMLRHTNDKTCCKAIFSPVITEAGRRNLSQDEDSYLLIVIVHMRRILGSRPGLLIAVMPVLKQHMP